MTVTRQSRKTRGRLFAGLLAASLALAGGRFAGAGEPVAADPQDGLAISGFDPVANFTEVAAKEGRPDLEYRWDGTTGRFRNEGNRVALTARPDIYSPRFGGYDPVAVMRGASVPGHPVIWLVSGQRLYLFILCQGARGLCH